MEGVFELSRTLDVGRAGKRLVSLFTESSYSIVYDRIHREKAMAALRIVEFQNGVRLSEADKRAANEYAKEVLGSSRFAPWLLVYTAVAGHFREGWIPDNYFGRVVLPQLNGPLAGISDLKSFSNVVLRSARVPDVAYVLDDRIYDRDMNLLTLQQLRDLVDDCGGSLVAKRDGTCQGNGVSVLESESLSKDVAAALGTCALQRKIMHHPFFEEFVQGPQATVRVVTVRDSKGFISARAPNLRFGREGTSWIGDDYLMVAITGSLGQLDEWFYDSEWRRWPHHPDSHRLIAGERVPGFPRAVEICIEAHARLPQLAIIGWDLIIDAAEEAWIIEWNTGHPGMKLPEAVAGPHFADQGWVTLAH